MKKEATDEEQRVIEKLVVREYGARRGDGREKEDGGGLCR